MLLPMILPMSIFRVMLFLALAVVSVDLSSSSANSRGGRHCEINLTSLLKSGSTWTEVVVLMLAERACKNDPGCHYTEDHAAGKAMNARTVGFSLTTDNERSRSPCNATVHFNAALKHSFWGLSFYRIGIAKSRSFFSQITVHCVDANIKVGSDQCVAAVAKAAPEPMNKVAMETRWLSLACLRDPRAVAVSECHWMGPSWSKNDSCREAQEGFATLVYATAFLYHYWTEVVPSRAHLVIYEKLLLDPAAQYRQIADFMGLGPLLTDAEIKDIAEATTAAALAEREANGTLLGKTKVSQFNGKHKIEETRNSGDKVGFVGMDGAKVFRGTAKGFLDDVSEAELEGMCA
jgi:hypothetical protein